MYEGGRGQAAGVAYPPQYDTFLPGGNTGAADVAETARERDEPVRSPLFVAMTHARDVLWPGSVAG
ncbi:hypothetical protein ACFPFX_11855 [Streptomyces mauvecolor]|uniref:Uncharacterized protein n=1 Tax=Streptomyces mauvecolor TaxID=58345 RepID=A0ABV9UKK9_9ACTN